MGRRVGPGVGVAVGADGCGVGLAEGRVGEGEGALGEGVGNAVGSGEGGLVGGTVTYITPLPLQRASPCVFVRMVPEGTV